MEDNINQDKAFLGKGWGFPPTFNRRLQSVEMLGGEDDIDSSLRILMTTGPGERAMRLSYGSKVAGMMYEPLNSSQAEVLKKDIEEAIFLHEPRIRPIKVNVEVEALEGKVTIEVEYRVVATNTRRNFVYPYYIIEGTEIRS